MENLQNVEATIAMRLEVAAVILSTFCTSIAFAKPPEGREGSQVRFIHSNFPYFGLFRIYLFHSFNSDFFRPARLSKVFPQASFICLGQMQRQLKIWHPNPNQKQITTHQNLPQMKMHIKNNLNWKRESSDPVHRNNCQKE